MQRDFDDLDPSRKLRGLVSQVDLELSNLPSAATVETPMRADWAVGLRGAWSRLVEELALDGAPDLRACPSCTRDIKRDATRCRYCLKISAAESKRPAV